MERIPGRDMLAVLDCAGTCILHLTSSMGVRINEVNAPEKAPHVARAGRESGSELV